MQEEKKLTPCLQNTVWHRTLEWGKKYFLFRMTNPAADLTDGKCLIDKEGYRTFLEYIKLRFSGPKIVRNVWSGHLDVKCSIILRKTYIKMQTPLNQTMQSASSYNFATGRLTC